MEKKSITEVTKDLIEGKKTINPGYKNPEIAKSIANEWEKQDLIDEGYLKSDEEKRRVEKIIINYYGKRDLAKQILEIQALYYDDAKIWWAWEEKKFRWKIVDETNILNFVNQLSWFNTISSKEKNEILEVLKQESRLKKPKDVKPTWIQFKNLIVDIKTGKELKASPKYFVTNPIPYALHKERFGETKKMDEIFEEWVGKEYVKTLYEIIAYCLIPDYPIHRLFCFIGEGKIMLLLLN